jgi:hypothetical protein
MTPAEKMRRYRARKFGNKPPVTKSHAAVAPLEARIRELEAELVHERTRTKMLESGLQNLRRQQRVERPPKAAKPPLPPDEARDQRIKALTTQVRNLKTELRIVRQHFDSEIAERGGMNFQTMSAIAKALHSDYRKHLTRAELDAELDEACKLFTSWKADKDKARRR